jgi:hypothetical protein
VTIVARKQGRDHMTVQLGAFLRTTLPLGLDALADYDGGR